jgi:hypothetical protein
MNFSGKLQVDKNRYFLSGHPALRVASQNASYNTCLYCFFLSSCINALVTEGNRVTFMVTMVTNKA